mmetsp:Transcript_47091/g.56954  ORF Transcript_47091/g.56954 Transcript_47091/m.56954 type:complete len:217 (+) Transcript_47091:87-737(+)|eukprot:CAMPEP_0172495146 /NCGR_PEP_ID=MMETSP1066-20121228/64172_1 /TAXON_ID=671091 /ORGANISM="Coscinodiscus wailesii, Strain CCMP2513" /LENGTH=216 /DNA_ID=CAMNT_0013266633 /DNA_START=83 /DNA_END=733 /DNA_ORIENTATION=+
MAAKSVVNFKVVLLGEGRVGKTSIMIRYVENTYTDRRSSTLSASYLDKRISLPHFGDANLSIWDTAGQERFHSLGPIYYRDADGAVVVYDITDAESFRRMKSWTKELRKMVGGEDRICIVVVGNKSDLESKRQVQEAEAIAYAESVGAMHFNASAKLNTGLDNIFIQLAQRMIDRRKSLPRKGRLGGAPVTGDRQKLVILTPGEETPKERSSSCCY